MRGEIICIGDELIAGRVRESNAAFAAAEFNALGISVGAMVVVGDVAEAIADALLRAVKRADFVLVTGGLGATDDDITAQVAAEAFSLPLTESARMVANLRAFFNACGLAENPAYDKLAQLPEGAQVLDAAACGFYIEAPGGVPVFFLPGVPGQMRRITREKVIPALFSRQKKLIKPVSRTLRVFGLPEPEIGQLMSGLVDGENSRLGYYPVFPEEHLVISVSHPDQKKAAARLDELCRQAAQRLGRRLIAVDETLESRLGRHLARSGFTLALAESCTGGLIAHRVTSVAGASDYFMRGLVVYSNTAKIDLLGVQPATLAAHGAVSRETAAEMAAGARERSGVDLALSVTGIAGPGGGSPEKPVGTVWFGVAGPHGSATHHRRFMGNREQIKALSAQTGLLLLSRYLEKNA